MIQKLTVNLGGSLEDALGTLDSGVTVVLLPGLAVKVPWRSQVGDGINTLDSLGEVARDEVLNDDVGDLVGVLGENGKLLDGFALFSRADCAANVPAVLKELLGD
jgi:hypothetical protein